MANTSRSRADEIMTELRVIGTWLRRAESRKPVNAAWVALSGAIIAVSRQVMAEGRALAIKHLAERKAVAQKPSKPARFCQTRTRRAAPKK